MAATSGERWRLELSTAVDDLVAQDPPAAEALDECFELAWQADLDTEGEYAFAIEELLRIADSFRGSDPGQLALSEVVELSLAWFRDTEEPRYVQGLARLFRAKGLSWGALTLLDRAIESEVVTSATLPRLLNARGETLREMNQPGRAEADFLNALAVLESEAHASDDEARSRILNNVGLVLYAKGDLTEARRLMIDSVELAERAGEDSREIGVTLDNLGAIEERLAADPRWRIDEDEHLEESERFLGRATRHFEAALPDSADDLAINLMHRANLAAQRRDFTTRESLSGQVFDLMEQGAALHVRTRWEVVKLRGTVLLEHEDAEGAVNFLYPRFRRLGGYFDTPADLTPGLATLVRAAGMAENQVVVEEISRLIIELDTAYLLQSLAGTSEEQARYLFQPVRQRAELVLGHCLAPAADGIAPPWLYELLLDRKGVLAERIARIWRAAHRVEGPHAELFERVRTLRAEAAQLDLDGSGAVVIRVARTRHEEANRRLGEAEAELDRALAASGTTLQPVDLGQVQECLGAALLLDFATVERPGGSRHYVVFKIRAEGPVRYRDLGPVRELDDRLRELTATLETSPGDRSRDIGWATAGRPHAAPRDIAPLLFEPGEVVETHVLVSPTGGWGRAPFCVLPDPDGEPLIEQHVLTLVPSGRWLVRSGGDTDGGGATGAQPLVIGDPDFDLNIADTISFDMSMRPERLMQTMAEAYEVAALLGVAPVLGPDATRSRLLGARRPRILHVATHGVFLEAIGSWAEQTGLRAQVMRRVGGEVIVEDAEDKWWPTAADADERQDPESLHRARVKWLKEIGPYSELSRSALLLAGFNAWLAGVETTTEVGMGLVSAREFSLLDLVATELVVLSACETGAGAVDYADGSLLGLRTAALAAGAATCVATLWPVIDRTAADLVSELYRQLGSGAGRAEALRSAQLAVRKLNPDPYHWAGWVMEGESGPVPGGLVTAPTA
jgi:hypothetical protein